MAKRKAQNDPQDDSNGSILTDSNRDNIQNNANEPSYKRLNPTPTKTRRTDQNYDPDDRKTNKKHEKYKKISSTFSDLSQIGDFATQTKSDVEFLLIYFQFYKYYFQFIFLFVAKIKYNSSW
jgi:hypothetical protein